MAGRPPLNRERDIADLPKGADILQNPRLNKDTAFTERERAALGLRGLLPAHIDSQEEQVERAMENYRAKPNDLEKYIYLTAVHDRNETLFYRILIDHIEEMMPVVYTPTVGLACQRYGHIFRRTRGVFISILDLGKVDSILANWPGEDIRVIVVTDGERILGLGDLGANGMGIPVGKLSLYTACAGIDPARTLPVTLDVGTNRRELLDDPLYLGIHRERCRGEDYDRLVDEFIRAANERYPGVMIQFEDFANINSFRLLERYRDEVCTFNDDIQGTAAVALAGLHAAVRIKGSALKEERILFLGAGGAGVGIGELIVKAMMEEGLDEGDARRRCWFVDSKGLVVKSREKLAPHKIPFAHEIEPARDFAAALERMKPTAIIGVSGMQGSFSEAIVRRMAEGNERPVIFALSNPTSKAECTAEDAYRWTGGRAIFASGSPFDPVEIGGRTLSPGQGNNAYIFPGLGLGVVAAGATRVTDEMFLAAARVLADEAAACGLGEECVYPPLSRIRKVSASIAVAVAQIAYRRGLSTNPQPEDLPSYVAEEMYVPEYRRYV